MTQRPSCPKCQSSFIVPDSTNGGAGRNVCMNCGNRAAVREFYQPSDPLAKMRLNAVLPVFSHAYTAFYEPGLAEEITKSGQHFLGEYGKLAAERAKLHTETPAAPIRQYKDED